MPIIGSSDEIIPEPNQHPQSTSSPPAPSSNPLHYTQEHFKTPYPQHNYHPSQTTPQDLHNMSQNDQNDQHLSNQPIKRKDLPYPSHPSKNTNKQTQVHSVELSSPLMIEEVDIEHQNKRFKRNNSTRSQSVSIAILSPHSTTNQSNPLIPIAHSVETGKQPQNTITLTSNQVVSVRSPQSTNESLSSPIQQPQNSSIDVIIMESCDTNLTMTTPASIAQTQDPQLTTTSGKSPTTAKSTSLITYSMDGSTQKLQTSVGNNTKTSSVLDYPPNTSKIPNTSFPNLLPSQSSLNQQNSNSGPHKDDTDQLSNNNSWDVSHYASTTKEKRSILNNNSASDVSNIEADTATNNKVENTTQIDEMDSKQTNNPNISSSTVPNPPDLATTITSGQSNLVSQLTSSPIPIAVTQLPPLPNAQPNFAQHPYQSLSTNTSQAHTPSNGHSMKQVLTSSFPITNSTNLDNFPSNPHKHLTFSHDCPKSTNLTSNNSPRASSPFFSLHSPFVPLNNPPTSALFTSAQSSLDNTASIRHHPRKDPNQTILDQTPQDNSTSTHPSRNPPNSLTSPQSSTLHSKEANTQTSLQLQSFHQRLQSTALRLASPPQVPHHTHQSNPATSPNHFTPGTLPSAAPASTPSTSSSHFRPQILQLQNTTHTTQSGDYNDSLDQHQPGYGNANPTSPISPFQSRLQSPQDLSSLVQSQQSLIDQGTLLSLAQLRHQQQLFADQHLRSPVLQLTAQQAQQPVDEPVVNQTTTTTTTTTVLATPALATNSPAVASVKRNTPQTTRKHGPRQQNGQFAKKMSQNDANTTPNGTPMTDDVQNGSLDSNKHIDHEFNPNARMNDQTESESDSNGNSGTSTDQSTQQKLSESTPTTSTVTQTANAKATSIATLPTTSQAQYAKASTAEMPSTAINHPVSSSNPTHSTPSTTTTTTTSTAPFRNLSPVTSSTSIQKVPLFPISHASSQLRITNPLIMQHRNAFALQHPLNVAGALGSMGSMPASFKRDPFHSNNVNSQQQPQQPSSQNQPNQTSQTNSNNTALANQDSTPTTHLKFPHSLPTPLFPHVPTFFKQPGASSAVFGSLPHFFNPTTQNLQQQLNPQQNCNNQQGQPVHPKEQSVNNQNNQNTNPNLPFTTLSQPSSTSMQSASIFTGPTATFNATTSSSLSAPTSQPQSASSTTSSHFFPHLAQVHPLLNKPHLPYHLAQNHPLSSASTTPKRSDNSLHFASSSISTHSLTNPTHQFNNGNTNPTGSSLTAITPLSPTMTSYLLFPQTAALSSSSSRSILSAHPSQQLSSASSLHTSGLTSLNTLPHLTRDQNPSNSLEHAQKLQNSMPGLDRNFDLISLPQSGSFSHQLNQIHNIHQFPLNHLQTQLQSGYPASEPQATPQIDPNQPQFNPLALLSSTQQHTTSLDNIHNININTNTNTNNNHMNNKNNQLDSTETTSSLWSEDYKNFYPHILTYSTDPNYLYEASQDSADSSSRKGAKDSRSTRLSEAQRKQSARARQLTKGSGKGTKRRHQDEHDFDDEDDDGEEEQVEGLFTRQQIEQHSTYDEELTADLMNSDQRMTRAAIRKEIDQKLKPKQTPVQSTTTSKPRTTQSNHKDMSQYEDSTPHYSAPNKTTKTISKDTLATLLQQQQAYMQKYGGNTQRGSTSHISSSKTTRSSTKQQTLAISNEIYDEAPHPAPSTSLVRAHLLSVNDILKGVTRKPAQNSSANSSTSPNSQHQSSPNGETQDQSPVPSPQDQVLSTDENDVNNPHSKRGFTELGLPLHDFDDIDGYQHREGLASATHPILFPSTMNDGLNDGLDTNTMTDSITTVEQHLAPAATTTIHVSTTITPLIAPTSPDCTTTLNPLEMLAINPLKASAQFENAATMPNFAALAQTVTSSVIADPSAANYPHSSPSSAIPHEIYPNTTDSTQIDPYNPLQPPVASIATIKSNQTMYLSTPPLSNHNITKIPHTAANQGSIKTTTKVSTTTIHNHPAQSLVPQINPTDSLFSSTSLPLTPAATDELLNQNDSTKSASLSTALLPKTTDPTQTTPTPLQSHESSMETPTTHMSTLAHVNPPAENDTNQSQPSTIHATTTATTDGIAADPGELDQPSTKKDTTNATIGTEAVPKRSHRLKQEDVLSSEEKIAEVQNLLQLMFGNTPWLKTCTTCGQECSSNESLIRHRKTQHRAIAFQCVFPGCTLGFSEKANLKRHVNSLHLLTKQFACIVPGCSHSFSRKTHLINHFASNGHDGDLEWLSTQIDFPTFESVLAARRQKYTNFQTPKFVYALRQRFNSSKDRDEASGDHMLFYHDKNVDDDDASDFLDPKQRAKLKYHLKKNTKNSNNPSDSTDLTEYMDDSTASTGNRFSARRKTTRAAAAVPHRYIEEDDDDDDDNDEDEGRPVSKTYKRGSRRGGKKQPDDYDDDSD